MFSHILPETGFFSKLFSRADKANHISVGL
jgi:hypothetical protein